MSLMYIHVPHTCGRLLNRILQSKTKCYHRIHNEIDYTDKIFDNTYIILRDPVERCIAEYTHYSNRYKQQNVKVNNMTISDESYSSIEKYYENECTNNIACKMLIQKPFNCPITDSDYNNILNMSYIYDIYTTNMKIPNLSILYNGISNDLYNKKYGQYITNNIKLTKTKNISQYIEIKNKYDIMLFNHTA